MSSPTNEIVVPAVMPVKIDVSVVSLSRTSIVVKAGFAANAKLALLVEPFSMTSVSIPVTETPVALPRATLKRSAPVPPLTTSDEVRFEPNAKVLEPVLAEASKVKVELRSEPSAM